MSMRRPRYVPALRAVLLATLAKHGDTFGAPAAEIDGNARSETELTTYEALFTKLGRNR